jgi:phage FluMu gp28-like protein
LFIVHCSLFTEMNPLNKLLPYQRQWVADQSRFKIGLWSRQTGKSTACAVEVVIDCLRQPNRQWVILSAGERQAQEFMKKIHRWARAMHTYLARELHNPYFTEPTCTKNDITWPNGSRAIALPANPDTARGYSANIILDEFAFYENPDALWRAIYPTITNPLAGGQKLLRIVTTPNGFNNRAHKIWTSAQEPAEPTPDPSTTETTETQRNPPDGPQQHPQKPQKNLCASVVKNPSPASNHSPPDPQKTDHCSLFTDHCPNTWSPHLLTIHHAVSQGLPIDIAQLRAGIDDPDAWAQEYECQFLDTQDNTLLPYNIILPCEPHTQEQPPSPPNSFTTENTEAQRNASCGTQDNPAPQPQPVLTPANHPETVNPPSSPSTIRQSGIGPRGRPSRQSLPSLPHPGAVAPACRDLPSENHSPTEHHQAPPQNPQKNLCASVVKKPSPSTNPSPPEPNQPPPQTKPKKLRARLRPASCSQGLRSVNSVVKKTTTKYPWQNHHQIPPPDRPQLFIGIDFARTRDHSVAWTLQRVNPDRSDPTHPPGKPLYITRDITHLSDLSTPRQAEILAARIPHAQAAAIDITGPGLGLGEILADTFGLHDPDPAKHRHGKIFLAHFTTKLKHTLFLRLRALMQDRRILIPSDPLIREDLHSWQRAYTPTGESTYTSPHTLNNGHGDHTIALALALHLAEPHRPQTTAPKQLQIQSIPRPPRSAW